MQTPVQSDGVARSIRSLTIAVWCLVAVNVVQVVTWMLPFIAPSLLTNKLSATPSLPPAAFESWHGLSFDEKAKRASVILITENKQEGGMVRAYVKEELQRRPGAVFHYKVGDEYPPLMLVQKENTSYGDGSLVLLSGSPAEMQESMGIFGGNVAALGNMPLSKVRQAIAAAQ